MSDPFIGQITYQAFYWTPVGYLACQGNPVAINQYQALFSLIGFTFGQYDRNTFYLPNLAGRAVAGPGYVQGGTINWIAAATQGSEGVTLTESQYPSHTHALSLCPTGTVAEPQAGAILSGTTTPTEFKFIAPPGNTTLANTALAPYGGGGMVHENRQPFVILNPVIATDGEYPDLP